MYTLTAPGPKIHIWNTVAQETVCKKEVQFTQNIFMVSPEFCSDDYCKTCLKSGLAQMAYENFMSARQEEKRAQERKNAEWNNKRNALNRICAKTVQDIVERLHTVILEQNEEVAPKMSIHGAFIKLQFNGMTIKIEAEYDLDKIDSLLPIDIE